MLFEEHDGGVQVSVVELVGHAPPQGTELATLLESMKYVCMYVCMYVRMYFEYVYMYVCVSPVLHCG